MTESRKGQPEMETISAEQFWKETMNYDFGKGAKESVIFAFAEAYASRAAAGTTTETRFDEFNDDSHPCNIWWKEHGQYMLSGGGRRDFIWACRGWIAREQLMRGVEVTGDSLHEDRVATVAPVEAKPDVCPVCYSDNRLTNWCASTEHRIQRLPPHPIKAGCIKCSHPWHSSPRPSQPSELTPKPGWLERQGERAAENVAGIEEVLSRPSQPPAGSRVIHCVSHRYTGPLPCPECQPPAEPTEYLTPYQRDAKRWWEQGRDAVIAATVERISFMTDRQIEESTADEIMEPIRTLQFPGAAALRPEVPCAVCGSNMRREELGWYCDSCQSRRWTIQPSCDIKEFYLRYTPQNPFDSLNPKDFVLEFAGAWAEYRLREQRAPASPSATGEPRKEVMPNDGTGTIPEAISTGCDIAGDASAQTRTTGEQAHKLTDEEFGLMVDMRDAAIAYTEQHPPPFDKKFYKVNGVRGMMADFAGHMILEDRKSRAETAETQLAEAHKEIGILENNAVEESRLTDRLRELADQRGAALRKLVGEVDTYLDSMHTDPSVLRREARLAEAPASAPAKEEPKNSTHTKNNKT